MPDRQVGIGDTLRRLFTGQLLLVLGQHQQRREVRPQHRLEGTPGSSTETPQDPVLAGHITDVEG